MHRDAMEEEWVVLPRSGRRMSFFDAIVVEKFRE